MNKLSVLSAYIICVPTGFDDDRLWEQDDNGDEIEEIMPKLDVNNTDIREILEDSGANLEKISKSDDNSVDVCAGCFKLHRFGRGMLHQSYQFTKNYCRICGKRLNAEDDYA